MARDIRIKPSSSLIQFSGSAGNLEATIELDTLGRLVLSSSQVVFGPGNNDVYIGDGTSSANLIFDRDGAIKAEPGSGAQIIIGSEDSRLLFSGSELFLTSSNLTIGPFSSSYANILSGSITGSFQAAYMTASVITASGAEIGNLFVNNFTSSYLALEPDGAIYFNDNTLVVSGTFATGSFDTGSITASMGNTPGDAFRVVSSSVYYTFIASGFDLTGSLPPDSGSNYYFLTGSESASAYIALSEKINTILTGSLISSSINDYIFVISASFTGSNYNGILFQSGSGSEFTTIATLAGGRNYTASFLDRGGSIYMDNMGNIVIDSISGSVYLAKNVNDIYIGDGTSSADIVFDFDGAVRGETGKNVYLTLGSSDTYLTLTGSTLNIGPYTASYAQINDGNITASVVSSSTLIGNDLYVTSSVSGNIAQFNTASLGLISGSRLNLNTNGGIFFTGSTATPGASIQLDGFGDLILSAVSGNVVFGSGSNEIYVGDGASTAALLFDFNSKIAGTPGTTLTIGSGSSNLLFTGSNINFQPAGGVTYFSGSAIFDTFSSSLFEGSFTGSFTGSMQITPTQSDVPAFTGSDGQFVFGTSGSIHYMYVWMSGAWRSSSLF